MRLFITFFEILNRARALWCALRLVNGLALQTLCLPGARIRGAVFHLLKMPAAR